MSAYSKKPSSSRKNIKVNSSSSSEDRGRSKMISEITMDKGNTSKSDNDKKQKSKSCHRSINLRKSKRTPSTTPKKSKPERNQRKSASRSGKRSLSKRQRDSIQKAQRASVIKKKHTIKNSRGHEYSKEDKKHIRHIFYTLESDDRFQYLKNNYDLFELTASLYGCSKEFARSTLENDGNDSADRREGHSKYKTIIPDTFKAKFEQEIIQAQEVGMRLTSRYFLYYLQHHNINVSANTVLRKMKLWGLRYGRLYAKDYRRMRLEVIEKRNFF